MSTCWVVSLVSERAQRWSRLEFVQNIKYCQSSRAIQTRFDLLHFKVVCSMKPTAKPVLAMNDFQYMYRTTGLMTKRRSADGVSVKSGNA